MATRKRGKVTPFTVRGKARKVTDDVPVNWPGIGASPAEIAAEARATEKPGCCGPELSELTKWLEYYNPLAPLLTATIDKIGENTTRDKYAAAALTGLLANADPRDSKVLYVRMAFELADAMMAARKAVQS